MERWRVSDSLSTDPGDVRRVVVRTVAGEVTVTSGPAAHIDVTREAGSDVDVRLVDGILNVTQPDAGTSPIERIIKWLTEARRHRCSVAVTAPEGASVDIVTVSSTVVVSGFRGGTRVKTVSGDITLSSLGERVDVKTVSGDVAAKGIEADVKLKSVSGDMSVVDGACSRVEAVSVSGDVLLDLDLDPQGTYDVSTVSGDVAVRTTSEPSLRLDVKTVAGDFVSDLGFDWGVRTGYRELHEKVGEGGALLCVRTVSGDLRLIRGRAAA
jgi:hypothetical protein